ncbi:MAG: helix-turn-helix transcriptional regulator [Pseudomonadota bacterium]
MLIKNQLGFRMQELGLSVVDVANRVGVSRQSVRYWLSGRSFPGKSKTPLVEAALSMKLDFSEGTVEGATVAEKLEGVDRDLLFAILSLPPETRQLFQQLASKLANTHSAAMN